VSVTSFPPRPSPREERLSRRLFFALSPKLPAAAQPAPPPALAPFEDVAVPRSRGPGVLAATWYPAKDAAKDAAQGPARGAVLLLHPWVPSGRAYFHLRGRVQALRRAGYHALTFDFPGFGGSGPRAGLFDVDVEDALAELRRRAGTLPLHVWGVSCGGSWAHPVLARTDRVQGAFFEDTSPHLIEWSWRMVPWGRPGYLVLRTVFSKSYRFLDARSHAGAMDLAAVTYISGERDPGVLPRETEELARLAGGRAHIVPGADHLGAIKLATAEILELALDTFQRAEEVTSRSIPCGTRSSPGGR
jgi:pimeloyl-ACP methyl ester carboxylesterase